MHFLLPPLFRGLARLFTLPHRRFYTPATDYNGPVPEVEGGFRSIPSVIDIPRMLELEGGDDAASSAVLPRYALAPRSRGGNGTASNGKFGNGFDSTDAAPPTSQSGESSAFLSPPTVHFSEKDPAVHDSKSSQAVRQPAAATAPATKHYDADGERSSACESPFSRDMLTFAFRISQSLRKLLYMPGLDYLVQNLYPYCLKSWAGEC